MRFRLLPDSTTLQNKQQTVDDVTTHIDELLGKHRVKDDELRECLGRANCIAGLMVPWRPSLGTLWAALLRRSRRGQAGKNKVWATQLEAALLYFTHSTRRRFLCSM